MLDGLFDLRRISLPVHPVDYLISRTTSRPRELIQIVSLAIDYAQRNGDYKVSESAIFQAEEQFLAWKLEHIYSENLFIYPDLGELIELFRGESIVIPQDRMLSKCADFVLDKQEHGGCAEWLRRVDHESDVVGLLYSIELIGAQKIGLVRDIKPIWMGYDFSYQRPKARLENSPQYMIHPALWKALDIVA